MKSIRIFLKIFFSLIASHIGKKKKICFAQMDMPKMISVINS
jgi:hypothetical protein